MFQNTKRKSKIVSAAVILELIYHSIVRDIRKGHGNALWAIGNNMLTTILFVLAFYFMFSVLGLRGVQLRGDFLLYMMSGIFIYLTHVRAMSAIVGAEGPSSPMMQHAPMNTVISITAAALGTLYIQVLSMFVILFAYHVLVTPFVIYQPIQAFGMLLLGWFTGISVGLVLLAIQPWFPAFVSVFKTLYQRANMIASGKMFVANALPSTMVAMFDWNPLFHTIDQARGHIFANYFPRNSNLEYPLTIGIILVVIGLMGEFYTRQYVSSSWNARR